jgi:hypothetical protein
MERDRDGSLNLEWHDWRFRCRTQIVDEAGELIPEAVRSPRLEMTRVGTYDYVAYDHTALGQAPDDELVRGLHNLRTHHAT